MRYLLPFFCFLVIGVKAQITIDNTDMPTVNDTFRYSIDNSLSGINPSATGTNFTWNYSSLAAEQQRLDEYVPVSSTPFAYQFYFNNSFYYPNHKADYAIKGRDVSAGVINVKDVYNYYKNSSAEYSWVGYGADINSVPTSSRNVPVDINYGFPLNYGNTLYNYAENGENIPGIGYYGQKINRYDTADGWGTLTTPFGTFSTLRVKSTQYITDTVYSSQFNAGFQFPRPAQIQYKWLAKGKGVPLLIFTEVAGQLTCEYRDMYRAVPGVGVKEYAPVSEVSVYPNPSINKVLYINLDSETKEDVEIRILDFSGKLVVGEMVSLERGRNTTRLNIEQLASGVYFIQLLNNKAVFVTEKVVVE